MRRLANFELGHEFAENYNFQEQLKDNQMTWKQVPEEGMPVYGLIVHEPSGMSIQMGLSYTTTVRHKCYTLNKLKDRVRDTGTWVCNKPKESQ